MWDCQVYTDTVAAFITGGPGVELPAHCVCTGHLVAHSTQQMLPCSKACQI